MPSRGFLMGGDDCGEHTPAQDPHVCAATTRAQIKTPPARSPATKRASGRQRRVPPAPRPPTPPRPSTTAATQGTAAPAEELPPPPPPQPSGPARHYQIPSHGVKPSVSLTYPALEKIWNSPVTTNCGTIAGMALLSNKPYFEQSVAI